MLPAAVRTFCQTISLRLWSCYYVPMLSRIQPVVEELSEERVVISVPLIRKNKNHLDSMYFGVLACGADLAGGILAMRKIWLSGEAVSFVFKNFQAVFLKRADSKVLFICEDGLLLDALVRRSLSSGVREEATVHVLALCPESFGQEAVARFDLTISLKKQKNKSSSSLFRKLPRKLFSL
ncbi:MAG: DUF4442 domain-containing protein [Deltaproteobacteria bacterium]|nr:DUF4442 domain-containing protein [Deltaproteobacteria bacterium]